jgi:hypothetical protein
VVAVVGGVLSHNPAFSTAGQIAGAMVFHVACMISGVWCLQRSSAGRSAERSQAAAGV